MISILLVLLVHLDDVHQYSIDLELKVVVEVWSATRFLAVNQMVYTFSQYHK
jgi:hypothetical protein